MTALVNMWRYISPMTVSAIRHDLNRYQFKSGSKLRNGKDVSVDGIGS